MKVKLNLAQRVAMKQLMAGHRGRHPEMVLARKVADDILSDELAKRYHVVLSKDGQFRYAAVDANNRPFQPEIEVDFEGEALKMITTDLKMLEEAGALNALQDELYMLFGLDKSETK